jgi:hypothetical protein
VKKKGKTNKQTNKQLKPNQTNQPTTKKPVPRK